MSEVLHSPDLSELASEAEAAESSPAPETADSADLGVLTADLAALPAPTHHIGEIVQGTIVKITDTDVLVDVGLKSEGVLPVGEFKTKDGSLNVSPGDVVALWVERFDEQEGAIVLSRQKAAEIQVWEKIERAYRDQTNLSGRVVERTKGGLLVDIGVRAFLPGSQADLRPLRNLDSLLGQEIACKIIKVIRKRNNVVVSRKLALEEEQKLRKAELLSKIHEGAEITGRVKNITDYGAFLELGGMDGLLHVTDMAWGRVHHPSDVVGVGQELRVKVLKYDAEKGRVSLGLKQLTPDPWERAAKAYPLGSRIKGKVVSVTDYGAFVELEPGIEGLIHVSEMSWSRRPKHPSKLVKPGELAEVAVLDLNLAQRRISLSLKQLLPDPWTTLPDRIKVGTVVSARIRNLTEFGAFAEVEDGVEGLIHISDLSWAEKPKHPSEIVQKGQLVRAAVLSLDPEKRRLSLGMKQLEADPWVALESRMKVGDTVKGKVSRLVSFGAFVDLGDGVEGLCHSSEMNDPEPGGQKGLEPGSEHEFRVIRLEPAGKKVGLSLRAPSAPTPAPEITKRQESPSTMMQALSSAGLLSVEPAPLAPSKAAAIGREPHT
jgi:small subunit ribosomal protein S1